MKNNKYPILICGLKGSGCSEVAELLARKIGYSVCVYDFSSFIRIAVAQEGLTFADFFAKTTESGILEHARLAALRSNTMTEGGPQIVIEGKSAFLGLDEKAFRILLVANRQKRVEHVASTHHVSIREATRLVKESDKKRSQIVKKLYRKNWLTPSLYDLVIDTTKISFEKVAEMIMEYIQGATDASEGVRAQDSPPLLKHDKPTLLWMLEPLSI